MRYLLLGVAFLLVLVPAACVGGGGGEAAPAPTAEVAPSTGITTTEEITPTEEVTSTEEEAVPTAEPSEEMTETVEINTLQVELVNGEIHMPESIPTGTTVFEVTNASTDKEHNFAIDGITEGFEQDLQPGDTQSVEVDLEPGEYTVYCPVDDHRSMGMELTLTVTEP